MHSKFRKPLLIAATSLFFLANLGAAGAASETDIQVEGLGVNLTVQAVMENSSTFVPLRAMGEVLGYKVSYSPSTKIIHLLKGQDTVSLAVGGDRLAYNGQEFKLKTKPVLSKGRVLLPVRTIAEALGAKVVWQGQGKPIRIVLPDIPGNESTPAAAKALSFSWYKFGDSGDGKEEWFFSSEPRMVEGSWFGGAYSDYMDFAVITDAKQYLSMPPLKTLAPIDPPKTDYNKNIVLWAYLGEARSGGHDIKITGISQLKDKVWVKVQTISPGKDEITTQALAYPTDAVQISKAEFTQQGDLTFTFMDQNGKVLKEVKTKVK